MTKYPLRDLAVMASAPDLRRFMQRAHEVGLDTLLDYPRLALLRAAVRRCRSLPGTMIEFGSYRGGSAALIASELTGSGKVLHVADSFQGLPAPGVEDNFCYEGLFNDTSAERVRSGLERLGLTVEMHVGFFNETLSSLGDLRLAFAHIDVDLYDSITTCLEFCYPRMTRGGIMIFDDYASPECLGAKLAVDRFFAGRPERVVRLSTPSYAVQMGRGDAGLLDDLRADAGWVAALPLVGRAAFK